ncbi:hypothetical protein DER44DRAFT_276942 [Fusarium oxysporum]|nr:hypothetical protein DER44DRAFT_276942 [Fusarium oxysporum]
MYGCRHVPQLTLATREKHTGSPCLNNAPECPVPGLEPRGKIPRSQTVEASIEAIVVLPPQSMESSTHPWQRQSCHLDGLVRFDIEASPLSCLVVTWTWLQLKFSAVRCGAVHRPESYVCPLFSILLRPSARQGSAGEGATTGAGERPLSSLIPKSSLRSVLLALRLYTTQMAKLQSPRYGSTQRLGALGIQTACPFITLIQFTARAMYEWSVSTRHY